MIRFGKRFRLIKKRDLVLYSAILLWLISIVLGSILDPDKHSTILEKVEFIGLSSTVFLALIIGIREFRLNGLRAKPSDILLSEACYHYLHLELMPQP